MSTSKTFFAARDAVSVTVTLTNGANHAVRLLRWDTPVDGIDAPLFVVTRDGAAVDYVGPLYKRAAPRAEDYIALAPGESLSRTVDVAEAYDVRETGNYAVHYRTDVRSLVSNEIHLSIEGRPSSRPDPTPTIGTAHFRNCSAQRQVAVRGALTDSLVIARNATGYLNAHSGGTPRYTTWFGTSTPSRHNTVRSHFTRITNAIDDQEFTFDCGGDACRPGVFAYVYPNNLGTIYFCDAFWPAPKNGTDSKSGTIVHETSHFTAVAGTKDHAYGQANCRDLARSNPDTAVFNADSHEYFAENTPPLP